MHVHEREVGAQRSPGYGRLASGTSEARYRAVFSPQGHVPGTSTQRGSGGLRLRPVGAPAAEGVLPPRLLTAPIPPSLGIVGHLTGVSKLRVSPWAYRVQ